MKKADIGVAGLAVMGANLARNLERNGYKVAVYNRTTSVTDNFVADYDGNFVRTETLEELAEALESPRRIMLMVKAGKAVDAIIDSLLPILDEGDIILDGGNTHYTDTVSREKRCAEKGIRFLGVGISGGEEGALMGASIMPGGSKDAWKQVSEMLSDIAAVADGPCTNYIGPDGAGHFVKMVHNGIEYADMQLIAESYDLLRTIGGYKPDQLSEIFSEWNKGPLESFLIEISATIFTKQVEEGYLVDFILDKAGQKGTGRWTVQTALEFGVPVPTIAAAVDARSLSARKEERKHAAAEIQESGRLKDLGEDGLVTLVHDALFVAKIVSYSQGMDLIATASSELDWELDLSDIARLWKGGCIIRAAILDQIQASLKEHPGLHLLRSSSMKEAISRHGAALRMLCARAARSGIPVPAFSASLSYLDLYTTEALPLNLTQAQRDFFGAHTYERLDKEGVFHTEWTE